MASEVEFKPQLRLHRLSWLFAVTTSIRQMIIPLLAVLVFGARDNASVIAPMVFPLIIAVLVVGALWRQWIYRYGFGPRGLVIHEGLIFRNVRQIEYPRIENIDTQRGMLHRLLGVAQVKVQTSTGGKPEAQISVLDLDAVQDMRARVFAETDRGEAEADQAAVAPLLRLSPAEVARFGLIDNRGMLLVAAASGVLYEMGMFRIDREIISAWLESSSIAGIAALGLAVQILLTVVAIAAALLAVRVLSVGVALVTLFDFTLTRHDGDLRARYGLFTRIALTLRTPRIQAVQQTQTLLHRWLKRVSLSVDLTGDRGGPEQQQNAQSKTRWLAPVCRPEQAPDLIKAALPMVDLTAGRDWQPLANGARGRIFRRTLLLWTLISAYPAVWYFREAAFLVAVAGAPFAWVHAHLYVKHTCWALAPDVLLFQRGWPTRRLTIAPRDRVQSVSMSTSPFDRRRHMASVFVDTAGGTLRGELNIRYLDSSTARRLVKELYRLG